MHNIPIFQNVKSIVSGKNPIQLKPKSVKYCIFKCGTGNQAYYRNFIYFIDCGDKCIVTFFSFRSNYQNKKVDIYLFKIKYDRLIAYRLEHNRVVNVSGKVVRLLKNKSLMQNKRSGYSRIEKMLKKWCARHNLGNKKSQLIDLLYPDARKVLDVLPLEILQGTISTALIKCKGYDHFLDRIFGFHGKKLKEILQSHKSKISQDFVLNSSLIIGKGLKGIVSPDGILEILSCKNFTYLGGLKPQAMRSFFRNFSEKSIRNWFSRDRLMELRDSIYQYYEWNSNKENEIKITLPDSNDINEIHDAVSRDYNRLVQIKSMQPIDYVDNLKKLNWQDIINSDYEIYAPTTSNEIINAGSELSNCLASYTRSHTKHDLILLVKKQNILKYAIQYNLQSKNIYQFYGKHNSIPDDSDKLAVLNLLTEKNFLKTS